MINILLAIAVLFNSLNIYLMGKNFKDGIKSIDERMLVFDRWSTRPFDEDCMLGRMQGGILGCYTSFKFTDEYLKEIVEKTIKNIPKCECSCPQPYNWGGEINQSKELPLSNVNWQPESAIVNPILYLDDIVIEWNGKLVTCGEIKKHLRDDDKNFFYANDVLRNKDLHNFLYMCFPEVEEKTKIWIADTPSINNDDKKITIDGIETSCEELRLFFKTLSKFTKYTGADNNFTKLIIENLENCIIKQ